jgi:PAS domain S-box-containing protein
MRQFSSSKDSVSRVLPFLTSITIAGAGVWILYPQPRLGDPLAAGLATVLLSHAPVVCPIVVGLAVGFSVWLLQRSAAEQHELKAANRALGQLNEQLKQEAQNVLQSEQRSQLLFLSNPNPMWIFDCDTLEITDVNEAGLRQYGYTRAEFLRLTALDIRPPDEYERLKARIKESESGYDFRGLWTHRRKDGTDFPVEIRVFRFVHDGHVHELVLSQDVSARAQAEEALLRSQAALKSMVDNAPFGVCGISLKDDCFVDFNPALADMLGGYSQEELLTIKLSKKLYRDP